MCGIAGIYNYKNDQPINENVLRRMTAALSHRGPDDEGFHVAGRVGLGHRRLSIVDVAGGHQPVFNEDGSVAVILNGEIYNYRELAKLVEARGPKAIPSSATLHSNLSSGPPPLPRRSSPRSRQVSAISCAP